MFQRKLAAIINGMALLGVGVVLLIATRLTCAQSAESLTANSTSEVATPSAFDELRRTTALKTAYLNSVTNYVQLETIFNDTRMRYYRFNQEDLLPAMVTQAAALYQSRDEMYLNYLNWVTDLVNTYAPDGVQIRIVGQNKGRITFNATSNSANFVDETISLGDQVTFTTQKALALADIDSLKNAFQEHYQLAIQIRDLDSWQAFNHQVFDPQAELSPVLYPIFAFTTWGQIIEANERSGEALTKLRQSIIDQSVDEVSKTENTKLLNQLQSVKVGIDQEVNALEAARRRVTDLSSYHSFTELTKQIVTNLTQVNQSLASMR